jgi:hypothetical protein
MRYSYTLLAFAATAVAAPWGGEYSANPPPAVCIHF